MFLIVVVVAVMLIGLRRGGLAQLAGAGLRLSWIPLAAFASQSVLVNFPVVPPTDAERIGPLVTVSTHAAAVVFLLVNRDRFGAKVACLGAALNLVVMIANGGFMPVTTASLERSGHLDRQVVRGRHTYVYGSKDVVLPASEIRLGFLADALSLPRPIPLAASFSVGDALIAVGASMFAFRAVSRRRQGTGVAWPGAGGLAKGGSGGFEGKRHRMEGKPMYTESMHRLIGRALTDPGFRERLLQSPAEAVRDLPLSRAERELVASLRAGSLEEFSRRLGEILEEANSREPADQARGGDEGGGKICRSG